MTERRTIQFFLGRPKWFSAFIFGDYRRRLTVWNIFFYIFSYFDMLVSGWRCRCACMCQRSWEWIYLSLPRNVFTCVYGAVCFLYVVSAHTFQINRRLWPHVLVRVRLIVYIGSSFGSHKLATFHRMTIKNSLEFLSGPIDPTGKLSLASV